MTIGELIERLEKATGPDKALDGELARAAGLERFYSFVGGGWMDGDTIVELPRYTASIDAALTLVGPTQSWVAHGPWTNGRYCAGVAQTIGGAWDDDQTGATAAIALCIAALKAREAARPAPTNRDAPAKTEA